MKPNEASRTAMFMALFRALESNLPPNERLFQDPIAGFYLPPMLRIVAAIAKVSFGNRIVCGIIDRRWPGSRTSGVARTRLIDDVVRKSVASDIRQVVLLGAGFDSRAYRIPEIGKAAVFEVDHPATSELKMQLTRKALGDIPKHVRFVQIDFNRQSLDSVLRNAGYKLELRTLFVWEGVSNYLTSEAVDSTLSAFSRAAPGSQVVFTYIDKEVLENPQSFYGTERLVKLLKDVGERWTFGIHPQELKTYLKKRGLLLKNDIGASQYRKQYFREKSEKMKGYEFYRVATATVERG